MSGLILEMLIPGLVFTTSVVVLASEFGYEPPKDLNNVFLGFGILIVSYLVGLVLRHWKDILPEGWEFLDDNPVMTKYLNTVWSSLVPYLLDRYTRLWPEKLRPRLVLLEDDSLGLDPHNAGLLVGAMRDKLLAKERQAWSDYLMYQWNFARLARNNFLPVSFAALVTIAGAINRFWFVSDDTAGGVLYLIATLLLIVIAAGLVRVHETRMKSQIGMLVRTSMELWPPDGQGFVNEHPE